MQATPVETISCPLCGEGAYQEVVEAYDRLKVTAEAFHLVRCAACSLVYQNPRVVPSAIGRFYPNDYFRSRPGRTKAAGTKSAREGNKRKLTERFVSAPGTVLDVGCSNGEFLAEMRGHGWSVEGVEISEDGCNYCRETFNLKVFQGTLDQRPDDGARFELITLWAVLPHLPNPVEVIASAASLLTANGKLMICCANIESVGFETMKSRWGHLDQPRHYCMFAPETLRSLYRTAGLEANDLFFDETVYHTNIVLRPVARAKDWSAKHLPGSLNRLAAKLLRLGNQLLTYPAVAQGQRKGRGGIIVAVGGSPNRSTSVAASARAEDKE